MRYIIALRMRKVLKWEEMNDICIIYGFKLARYKYENVIKPPFVFQMDI